MKPHFRGTVVSKVLCVGLLCGALSGCRPKTARTFQDIAEPIKSAGWIKFKHSARVNPATLFQDHAALFHLTAGNEMRVKSEDTDATGITHFRYQQYFKGIEVENAEFMVHARNGLTLSANGGLAYDFQPPSIEPAVSEDQAIDILRKHFSTDHFLPEDHLAEQLISRQQLTSAPHSPKGKLVFMERPGTTDRPLAWVFRAYIIPLDKSRQVYVDAITGAILKEIPVFPSCFAGGGNTTFRGPQHFNTAQSAGNFVLMDDCNGTQLHFYNLNSSNQAVEATDPDNNWTGNDMSAVTSFWDLGVVYDYFRLIHGRTSYDNRNTHMFIFNDPKVGENANGGNGLINLGLGSKNVPTDDYNTVDIVGHEFTHSVIQTSANLSTDPAQESSALNESFADIFGKASLRWEERNINPEWIIGGEKGCVRPALCRDMKNPKTFGQPDTYKGNNWVLGGTDPHQNNSVQNRWFALLSDGGTGTNTELKTAYSINGIGITKASQIAYRALTRYLLSNSDYNASRDATIGSAQDLFGDESTEQAEVTKSWCAVGLCPYTLPQQPDIFDRSGGNPNPASPNNNNSVAAATPLPTASYTWSPGNHPNMTIADLSIYPPDDVDYFHIQFPDFVSLGGNCFTPGFSFRLGMPVDATVYVNGKVVSSFHNVPAFSIGLSETQGTVLVSIAAPFPGQIFNYSLNAAFFVHYNETCYQPNPPTLWQEIHDCVMCDFRVLSPGEKVVLDPFYRQPEGVDTNRFVFNRSSQGMLNVPVKITAGKVDRVELVNTKGQIVAEAESTGTSDNFILRAPNVGKGIYSLRFQGFRSGTEVEVPSLH
jgi:Zn-dependent metalloprotease